MLNTDESTANDKRGLFTDWLRTLISERFGEVQERLFDEGVLDSLNAVELGLELEDRFNIRLADLSIADMQSISGLAERLSVLVKPDNLSAAAFNH